MAFASRHDGRRQQQQRRRRRRRDVLGETGLYSVIACHLRRRRGWKSRLGNRSGSWGTMGGYGVGALLDTCSIGTVLRPCKWLFHSGGAFPGCCCQPLESHFLAGFSLGWIGKGFFSLLARIGYPLGFVWIASLAV